MSFISNASGITLGEGTFNNVQGNLVNIFLPEGQRADIGALMESILDERRRREDSTDVEEAARRGKSEEEDGLEIIRHKDLDLTHEIGGGPGYLLHAGNIKRRAVIVKVFNAGMNARKHLEATVKLSQRLLHPNVLRIEGISSSTSIHHFIAYEDAHRKKAEGPLAAALRDDLDKSIVLGFKMISSLSSGINYLHTEGIALALGPENFDIFLDINERFLLSINPPTDANVTHQEQDDAHNVWTLFNGLCQKVLRSANRVLHDEDIERTPTVFDSSVRSPALSQPSPMPSLDQAFIQTKDSEEATPTDRKEAPSVPPRREYVWRTMDVPQSLISIATQIARDLDLRRASINRLARSDSRSIHRCPGYLREEVTLATRTADSAVVSHDTPTIQEVCSVCHEVVNSGEVFLCVCGQKEPGSRPTFKCRSCKSWSHRDCGPTASESICSLCTTLQALHENVHEQHVLPVASDTPTVQGRHTIQPGSLSDLQNQSRSPPVQEFPARQHIVEPMRAVLNGVNGNKLGKLGSLGFGKKRSGGWGLTGMFGSASSDSRSLREPSPAMQELGRVDVKKNKKEAERIQREAEKQRRALAERMQREQARAVMQKRNQIAPRELEWGHAGVQQRLEWDQTGKQAASGPVRQNQASEALVTTINAAAGRFMPQAPATTINAAAGQFMPQSSRSARSERPARS
ncbi:hypothetical protein FB45DRAFT_1049943 [Roridomyces roridus]|uniref:Protein kinase domain-containing protein n=1 Tax=Roridomyces roridus TaxID=1738132 RepID=A0AAD7CHZ1_9AGAR|nr:hypothetical protein FB45DRAFT_1049943 [Roridomyces roridus]